MWKWLQEILGKEEFMEWTDFVETLEEMPSEEFSERMDSGKAVIEM
jgi:hypothetical protein